MGKYSKVIDKLPRYMGDEPKYQERVEATKRSILDNSIEESIPEPILAAAVNLLQHSLRKDIEPALKMMAEATGSKQRYASTYGLVYKFLRDIKEELEAHESNVNLLLEAYGQLLDEQLEVECSTAVTLDNGFNVRVQKEPYTQIKDKEAFRKWCIENGYENEMQLYWQTANGICKERLLEGLPEPAGVELYSKPKVVVTKPRA